MKTLLVPTNFSATTRNALNFAVSFSRDARLNGTVLLLNTYLVPPAAPDQLVRINDDLREASLKNLESELRAIERTVSDGSIRFETLSHLGSLKNVVDHLTTQRKIDCLVIGYDGEADLATLKSAHCPLLLVPLGARYQGLGKAVFVNSGRVAGDSELSPLWQAAFGSSESCPKVLAPTGDASADVPKFVARQPVDLLVWHGTGGPMASTFKKLLEEVALPASLPTLCL